MKTKAVIKKSAERLKHTTKKKAMYKALAKGGMEEVCKFILGDYP